MKTSKKNQVFLSILIAVVVFCCIQIFYMEVKLDTNRFSTKIIIQSIAKFRRKVRFFSYGSKMNHSSFEVNKLLTLESNVTISMEDSENLQRFLNEKFGVLINYRSETEVEADAGMETGSNHYIVTNKNCPRQDNVVFLKTHKTGSSTITSILNRFAELNDLRMLLPRRNRFNWPYAFGAVSRDLSSNYTEKANLLANHARFDKKAMMRYMEKDSKFITILRNPVTLFESVFHYQEFDGYFFGTQIRQSNNSFSAIDEFFKSPMLYYLKAFHQKKQRPEALPLLRNGMAYDLGYDAHIPEHLSDNALHALIGNVTMDFDLVLVTEHFDESLVLMKREFCWSFEDILYMKHNARTKAKVKHVSPTTAKYIKEWSYVDYKLYQHFNQTFWRKIEKHGDSFWEDVREFRAMNKDIQDQCSVQTYNDKAVGLANVKINSFKMGQGVDRFHRPFCQKLFLSEVDYIQRFRRHYQLKTKLNRRGIDIDSQL